MDEVKFHQLHPFPLPTLVFSCERIYQIDTAFLFRGVGGSGGIFRKNIDMILHRLQI